MALALLRTLDQKRLVRPVHTGACHTQRVPILSERHRVAAREACALCWRCLVSGHLHFPGSPEEAEECILGFRDTKTCQHASSGERLSPASRRALPSPPLQPSLCKQLFFPLLLRVSRHSHLIVTSETSAGQASSGICWKANSRSFLN